MEETAVEQEPKATEEKASVEPVEKSLDELLAEYDQGEAKPEQEPVQKESATEILDFVRSQKEREKAREARESRDALVSAVSMVKETGVSLSDKLIEARLHIEAQDDPRVAEAWLRRESNPGGWESVLKAVGKKIAGEMATQPDPQLTADRDAVRDSVRGSSTQAPEVKEVTNEDLDSMSDAEYEAHKKQLAKKAG
jgi:hypothetical protein